MNVLAALYRASGQIGPLEQAIMAITEQQEKARRDAIAEAQRAYEGDFPDPLTVEAGEPRDIVKVNLIKPIVNVGVHYLFGEPPEIEVPGAKDGEATGTEDSPQEEWLQECLRRNEWPTFLLDIGINGATGGTPYYGIDTDEPYENTEAGGSGKPYPRFYCIDPAAMTVRTEPHDITRTVEYEWRYNSARAGADGRPRPVIERKVYALNEGKRSWTIQRQVAYLNPAVGQSLYGQSVDKWQDDGPPVLWDKPWPPIAHCKNLPAPNQVYGAPDVTDTLIEANKAINFNLSNRQRIDKHHAAPTTALLGYAGDLNIIKSGIGELVGIPGENVTTAVLAPQVDSSASGVLKAEIHDAMLEESATPSIVLGKVDDGGVPSGVALRMRMAPMLQKTEAKRKLYAPFLVELVRRLFELADFGADIVVTLTWPELVPGDEAAQTQGVLAIREAGLLSDEGAAVRLDIDWKVEAARIEGEQAAKDARNAKLQEDAMKRRAAVMGPNGAPPMQEGADNANGAATGQQQAPPPTR
jgi:hypothetical protein